MKKRIITAAILAAFSPFALSFTPFEVKDIRVEGIQRTEAGTVFSYLPIKIGDRVDDDRVAAAIKALYATGFFSDVRIEADKDALVISVIERAAIAQIAFSGNKEFDEETLRKGLRDAGIAESRIFDRSVLERAEQEIKRLYLTRSLYGVRIRTTTSPLERNRVAVNFEIEEGERALIKSISVKGAKAFKESNLLDQIPLTTSGWFTWFTKSDQYSKPKLEAGLESIKSYYLDRGYIDFSIASSQVTITPDKRDVHISIAISEGELYKVSSVKLAGEFLVPEAELKSLVGIVPGELFSRRKMTETSQKLSDRIGNEGYAFANVNPAPEVDRAKREVALTFFIDPGRRAYVNRINILGNSKTRDTVIRRELRQAESAWFDREKVNRSKERLTRTGYFEDVSVQTVPLPGKADQVDLNVEVKERPTGNITLGAGYSQTEKFVLSGGISQDNLFGTGNALSLLMNTGKINRNVNLAFTNPYITTDGISAGFDLYNRRSDPTSTSTVAKYKSEATGVGLRFGVPISETSKVNLGLSFDHTRLTTFQNHPANGTSPQQYLNYVKEFGDVSSTLAASVGWSNDERDSPFYPTTGTYQRVGADVAIPPAEVRYTRLYYQWQRFFALNDTYTLMLNADLGHGMGYGGKPYPFFRNFYAGGIGSVRGYDDNSLGPRQFDPVTGQSLAMGGQTSIVTNAELLFPFPGVKENSKTFRLSLFLDGGYVWGEDANGVEQKIRLADLRYSAGLAFSWMSPIGPLKLSMGYPLNKKEGDSIRRFQFQIGQMF